MINNCNDNTELILKMNGQEHSWKGPWDSDINDILDAFYGLLTGATFSPKMLPVWMKEWAEEKLDDGSVSVDEEEEEIPSDGYGRDGRRVEEDGITGYFADGTPDPEFQPPTDRSLPVDDLDD